MGKSLRSAERICCSYAGLSGRIDKQRICMRTAPHFRDVKKGVNSVGLGRRKSIESPPACLWVATMYQDGC